MILSVSGCTKPKNVENKEYYKDDEGINLFINKYNMMFEQNITSDMITKKHIHGSDRDNIVTIKNDILEIDIYDNFKRDEVYSMSVYVGYIANVESTNDDFKKQFYNFIKMFAEELTENQINK